MNNSEKNIIDETFEIEKIIFDNLTDIRYIYHISDIHIRINQRHKEYRQVFKNLYSYLNNQKSDNSIIVITGDILHSKTDLSPECISLVSELLKNLKNIMPIIIIPGNHDCNLSNKYRMDSLTPIIDNINDNNIIYLKNTGKYLCNNVIFYVTSVFDEIFIPFLKEDKKENSINIYLYHGQVNNACTDVGTRLHGEFAKEQFNGYDYVLLGDVHKFQYLDKDKKIAYAGSLIQQNYGESLDNHGLIKWDIISGESEFIPIKNNYGYCTVKVVEGKYDLSNLPKYPRIRFYVEENSKHLVEEIKQKVNIQESVTYIENKNVEIKKNDSSENDLLLSEFFINDDLKDDILRLHKKIKKNIRIKEVHQKNKLDFIELKFSNMISYGKDNVINFEKFEKNKVIGIMAPNHYGKSAVIDILLFSMFGKFSRGQCKDILNKNCSNFSCELLFSCNGRKYKIERSGEKNKNSIKSFLKFYEIIDEEYIDLSGIDKNDTENKISEYIGIYDNYINTYFSLQNDKSDLLEMSPLEKKNYLHKILNIDYFEELFIVAKKKHKELLLNIKSEKENLIKYNFEQYKKKYWKQCVEEYLMYKKEQSIIIPKTINLLYNVAEIKEELKETEEKIKINIDKINFLNKKIINIDISKKEEYLKEINRLKNIIETTMIKKIIYIDDKTMKEFKNFKNETVDEPIKPPYDSEKLREKLKKYPEINISKKTYIFFEDVNMKYRFDSLSNNIIAFLKKISKKMFHNEHCNGCINNKCLFENIILNNEGNNYREHSEIEKNKNKNNEEAVNWL